MVVSPTIVIHATAPLNMLAPFEQLLRNLGITVLREDYDLERITRPGVTHLIWAMRYEPPIYRQLARFANVFFMENGWFTQRSGFYIDKQGTNAQSSIRGSTANMSLDENQLHDLELFLAAVHRRANISPVPGTDYLFVPLQVERDSQVRYFSGCDSVYPNRQAWFVDQVCKVFRNRRIIIRPHPRDPHTVSRIRQYSHHLKMHPRVSFRSEGSSYDWAAGAKAVAGINSTVLLESLSLRKPVCAMGFGLFSDNGVVLECDGRTSVLASLDEYEPDADALDRFLCLLMMRQIPYRLRAEDIPRYPVLMELIDSASPQIAWNLRSSIIPSRPSTRSGDHAAALVNKYQNYMRSPAIAARENISLPKNQSSPKQGASNAHSNRPCGVIKQRTSTGSRLTHHRSGRR